MIKKFKRIGILGGTFNPIHIGHLAMAQTALEKLNLDKVIFVPTAIPPHKKQQKIVAAHHRYKMVQLAIKGNSHFEISDVELKRKGKSYTIDTVRYYRGVFPSSTKLFFIMGGDSLAILHTWKDINELKKLVTFVVLNRPGVKEAVSKIKVKKISMPGLGISSTHLRRSIATSKTDRYLLPREVFRYIKSKKLYL